MLTTVLLVIHLIVTIFLIGIILIQRSDGDGFATGGGGSSFMSGRAKANVLTRTTAALAAIFIINSLVMAIVHSREGGDSLIDRMEQNAPAAEATDAKPAEEAPKKPAEPVSVPKPKS